MTNLPVIHFFLHLFSPLLFQHESQQYPFAQCLIEHQCTNSMSRCVFFQHAVNFCEDSKLIYYFCNALVSGSFLSLCSSLCRGLHGIYMFVWVYSRFTSFLLPVGGLAALKLPLGKNCVNLFVCVVLCDGLVSHSWPVPLRSLLLGQSLDLTEL